MARAVIVSLLGLAYGLLAEPSTATLALNGAPAGKRELSSETYDQWNKIAAPVLSSDGNWVVYQLETASDVAGELVVRATHRACEYRISGATTPTISHDSRFVFFMLPASNEQNGVGEDGSSRLGILHLQDGLVTRLPRVVSFKLPRDAGRHISYLVDNEAPTISTSELATILVPRTLMLREVHSATEVQIPEVVEFSFDAQGRYLAYTVQSDIPERSGAYVRQLSNGHVKALLSGAGQYRGLTFDATGQQLAFLSTRDDAGRSPARYTLYYSASPLATAGPIVSGRDLKDGLITVGADDAVKFNRDGSALIFHIVRATPAVTTAQRSATLPKFDLWHWQASGPTLQGQLLESRKQQSYLSVYHIASRRWVQLGSDSTSEILLTDNARYAVGIDATPYAAQMTRDPLGTWIADIYVIDALTGARRLLSRGLKPLVQMQGSVANASRIALSPQGRYALYYAHRRAWSIDLRTGRIVDLTGALLPDVHFGISAATNSPLPQSQDLLHTPALIAGWTQDDRRVLLYSQYDLWEIDPAGIAAPRNLTAAVGQREHIVFRLFEDFDLVLNPYGPYRSLPRFKAFLDPEELLLMAMDQDTMSTGVWRLRPGASPEKLLMRAKRITPTARARKAQQYLLTMETFSEYPDLWTGSRFDNLTKISDANPQQNEYRWGNAELVHFISDWGAPLKGILYKPEDFDPSKEYPMIVSVYQVSSLRLHKYANPQPLAHSPVGPYPWPEATSRGYLRFVPDILTASPYPGPSALAAVVPAVQSIIDRGFVKRDRIALTGHSFGAFETIYMITQTNMFRCAVADAGLTNILSYYGTGIGTGFVERMQPALGGSIWERPFVFIINSALFYADRVQTPVLMMHNDKDVHPMSQSVEFFTALKRNGRHAYLFNYHDEEHILLKQVNRLDWNQRVNEWLDHWLKDAPRPEWMNTSPRSAN